MKVKVSSGLSALLLMSASCAPPTPEAQMRGRWVRADHSQAWFVTFDGNDEATFDRPRRSPIVGTVVFPEPDRMEIQFELSDPALPAKLELRRVGDGDDWSSWEDAEGEAWHFVRYGPLPEDLVGRWLTLPQADERYFIEIEEPNSVLWRRRFGMRRSEDRVGRGWTRGDSLFMNTWNAMPIHYEYEIRGDTLAFERPGVGPFGRYVRSR